LPTAEAGIPVEPLSEHPAPSSALVVKVAQQPTHGNVSYIISAQSNAKLNALTAKIHPEPDHSASTFLSSPEAVKWRTLIAEDRARQRETALVINAPRQYNNDENEYVASGLGLAQGLKLNGISPFKDYSKGAYSTTNFAKGFFNTKSGDIYVCAENKITARAEDVAASLFDYDAKFINPALGLMKEYTEEDGSLLTGGVIEKINAHHHILYQPYCFPSPMINREVICAITWKRMSATSIMVVYSPLKTHQLVEDKDGGEMIRATVNNTFIVTQLDSKTCSVEYNWHVNFGGALPSAVVESFLVPAFLRIAKAKETHFIMQIKLDDLEERNGRMLGEVFVFHVKAARARGGWKKKGELGKQGVDEFLCISVAMRELLVPHPWMRVMMHTIVNNTVSPSSTIAKKLAEVTEQDALQLAKGFVTIVLSNTEAKTAVDHWVNQNSCVREFVTVYPWSRSFFVEVAQCNLLDSNMGVVARVTVGATLSTVDLASDVYMTNLFLSTKGMVGYGKTNATILGVTMGIQMIVSCVQNQGKPRAFLKDAAIISVGAKPAYDAWKVGSGAEQEDHQVWNPLTEMTFFKSIETVFEAIPSSLVQIYAILDSGNTDNAAILSVLVSAAATAFTSVMISYDWDTSPSQRALNNKNFKFYGFVPDGANERAACFAAMFLLTFAHTLARSFSCALLAIVNKTWLAMYVSGGVLVYCLYKLSRGDLRYSTNLSPAASVMTTFLMRLADKVIIDFTATAQFRHPGQAGGVAFTGILIESQVGCYFCGWLYLTHFRGSNKLDDTVVWSCIGALSGLFLLGLAVFLLVANKEFLGSFFSTDTAATFYEKWFEGVPDGDDETKSSIFSTHPVFRTKVEIKIAAWTKANWERWEREQPAWFTDAWIESVPNHCIPYKYCVKYKKTKGRRESDARRGSVSVKELIGLKGAAETR
jgi:hypothetical protein